MAREDAGWISGKARYLPKVHGRRQGPSKNGLYAILRVTISWRAQRCQLQTLAENTPPSRSSAGSRRGLCKRVIDRTPLTIPHLPGPPDSPGGEEPSHGFGRDNMKSFSNLKRL